MNATDNLRSVLKAKKEKDAKSKKVEQVMREFKEGKLKSSSGAIITDRKQAVAITMSESGQAQKAEDRMRDLLKAKPTKYSRRWKGKGGGWQYEYKDVRASKLDDREQKEAELAHMTSKRKDREKGIKETQAAIQDAEIKRDYMSAKRKERDKTLAKLREQRKESDKKTGKDVSELKGQIFRPFTASSSKHNVEVVSVTGDKIKYKHLDTGEVKEAKTKDFLESYIGEGSKDKTESGAFTGKPYKPVEKMRAEILKEGYNEDSVKKLSDDKLELAYLNFTHGDLIMHGDYKKLDQADYTKAEWKKLEKYKTRMEHLEKNHSSHYVDAAKTSELADYELFSILNDHVASIKKNLAAREKSRKTIGEHRGESIPKRKDGAEGRLEQAINALQKNVKKAVEPWQLRFLKADLLMR